MLKTTFMSITATLCLLGADAATQKLPPSAFAREINQDFYCPKTFVVRAAPSAAHRAQNMLTRIAPPFTIPYPACSQRHPQPSRPGGFAKQSGRQACCVADKAIGMMELLYAIHKCKKYQQDPHKPCYYHALVDVLDGITDCCAKKTGKGATHRCKAVLVRAVPAAATRASVSGALSRSSSPSC